MVRYSHGKLFYKPKNATVLNRNNNITRQIQIIKMMWGLFAMIRKGRNGEKKTFFGFVSHELSVLKSFYKLLW